jgi:hypothetical protein
MRPALLYVSTSLRLYVARFVVAPGGAPRAHAAPRIGGFMLEVVSK